MVQSAQPRVTAFVISHTLSLVTSQVKHVLVSHSLLSVAPGFKSLYNIVNIIIQYYHHYQPLSILVLYNLFFLKYIIVNSNNPAN